MSMRDKIAKTIASGIKAYHSSPHDFDRFDFSKIGTGEGVQAYGHGLYFAENPAVSGQGGEYWRQFLPRFEGHERRAAERLLDARFDRNKAMALTERDANDWGKRIDELVAQRGQGYRGSDFEWQDEIANAMKMRQARGEQLDLLASGKPVGPRTYEVNINADPAHFLDWDKAFKGQSSEVKRAIWDAAPYLATGGDRRMGMLAGSPLKSPDTAAQLRNVGVPGIKYLDAGSRFGGEGTSNYVVFDPGIIQIMRKYGIAGVPAAGAIGSLAAQDSYGVQ